MKLKKSVSGPRVWTVAELGAFYTEHRSELLAHANRVLKDSAKAEEITQGGHLAEGAKPRHQNDGGQRRTSWQAARTRSARNSSA